MQGSFSWTRTPCSFPGAEVTRGTGIHTFAPLRIEELREPEDDAYQVVGAALVVGLLHRRRDLVVGLGDYIVQSNG